MFFVVLLLIIFFVYYFPRILMWIIQLVVKHKLKKAYQNVFTGNMGNPSGNASKKAPHAAGSKKIAKDIGEYIRFEEIEVNETDCASPSDDKDKTTSATKTPANFETESQIVDVEWEDIP